MNKSAAAFFATTLLAAPFAHAVAWAEDDEDSWDGDEDQDDDGPVVPPELAVPAGYEVKAHFEAEGVQIYTCALTSSGSYAWTFVAPSATLYDKHGDEAGTHYAGPTWEANDASKVVGKVLVKSAAPDGTSIPWLLLSATVTQTGKTFKNVAYVQRLNTGGGSAPATGCSSANVGAPLEVPYTADYWFYALD
jgi:hypothetical protein